MAAVGVNLQQSDQKCQFNVKNIAVLSIIAISLILSSLYTFGEAESFDVFVDSAFASAALVIIGVIFTNCILITTKLNKFLASFEHTIGESK